MKSYKDEVVDNAIIGLRQGGIPDPDAFRLLFERIYDCGYYECRRENDERTSSRTNESGNGVNGC